MSEEDNKLRSTIRIKLTSMDDLVRMAFANMSRNSSLNFLFYKDEKTKKINIGFLSGVAGYFDLRGLPMFFYTELEKMPEKFKFVKYTSFEKEKWEFCDATSTSTQWLFLPIVQLAEKPSFF
ncbi:MAG: hypothetical protein FK734_18865 [Asgard group archaeon]|nr:hypothetical protein [Asgard group archaeon]